MKSLYRWLMLIGLSVLAFPLVPAVILLFGAQTWRGHLVGGAAVLVAVAFGALPRSRAVALAAGGSGLLAVVVLYAAASAPTSGARFQTHFLSGAHDGWALASVVPEIDQIAVGLVMVPFIDPYLDREEGARLRERVLATYREMNQDREVAGLGSELGQCYRQVWAQEFDAGHYYLAKPQVRGAEKPPAVIFLHGSLGNSKLYLWALRELSQRHGYYVAHPSFGFGRWDLPGGAGVVERVRRHLVEVEGVDPTRIYLVGVSNGGLGVSVVGAQNPHAYRGLGFISSVFHDRSIEDQAFGQAWKERPIWVVTGEDDDRVPAYYVARVADQLQQAGASVRFTTYEGEDHFLLLSSRERVVDELVAWMEATRTSSASTVR